MIEKLSDFNQRDMIEEKKNLTLKVADRKFMIFTPKHDSEATSACGFMIFTQNMTHKPLQPLGS